MEAAGLAADTTGKDNCRAPIAEGAGTPSFFVQYTQQYLFFLSRQIAQDTGPYFKTLIVAWLHALRLQGRKSAAGKRINNQ